MVPVRYNARNLFVRWKTTFLTAAGFTLVVALLVVMLAFVQGLNALAKKTGPAGNVVLLRDGANDELFSDLAIDASLFELWSPTKNPEILKDEKGNPYASQEVYSIATQEIPPTTPDGRPSYRFLQIRGVENVEMSAKVHDLKLKDGKWFDRTGNDVVMGDGIARTLGLTIGDDFYPRGRLTGAEAAGEGEQPKKLDLLKWTVVGIVDSRGSPFDSEIWAKREDVGKYFGKDNEERKQSFYTTIVVTTKDQAAAEKFVKEIQGRTQVRVAAMTEKKYYEEMNKSNQTFLVAAIFIAVVMAIGGMFGLMNTMFAAVSQRIKDIGVLRILGYKRWQILLSFMFESLLLAILGGLLGLAIGYSVNNVEQTGFMSAGQGGGKTVVFKMIVDSFVLTAATVFTLGMGFIGGFFPAWSAMRQKPLDALR